MVYRIRRLEAYELLDSRGNPTLGCAVWLEGGGYGFALVPSGASRGKTEAYELRDGDARRYHGKGVLRAVSFIEQELAAALCRRGIRDPEELDSILEAMDGTEDLSRYGGNTLLAVSLAFARAVADAHEVPLYQLFGPADPKRAPIPLFNVLNGGLHADNSLDFQEFLLVPAGIAEPADRVRAGVEIYHTLREILQKKGESTLLGDEGGFAPDLETVEDALDLLWEATERAGYRVGEEIFFGIDAAASQFYDAQSAEYVFHGHRASVEEYLALWERWLARYPILYVEDPCSEEAPAHWRLFRQVLQPVLTRRGTRLVADDLTTTQAPRIRQYHDCANGLLAKVNQAGTLRRTLEACQTATHYGWVLVISHRSGDTEDSFIVDLAVGLGAWGLKAGAPARSERTAKYNRYLRIFQPRPKSAPPAPQPQRVSH